MCKLQRVVLSERCIPITSRPLCFPTLCLWKASGAEIISTEGKPTHLCTFHCLTLRLRVVVLCLELHQALLAGCKLCTSFHRLHSLHIYLFIVFELVLCNPAVQHIIHSTVQSSLHLLTVRLSAAVVQLLQACELLPGECVCVCVFSIDDHHSSNTGGTYHRHCVREERERSSHGVKWWEHTLHSHYSALRGAMNHRVMVVYIFFPQPFDYTLCFSFYNSAAPWWWCKETTHSTTSCALWSVVY